MTRRIALSVLALITAILVLAVVPLGLLMTEREQTSFRDEAAAKARGIASAAEEHLSDQKSDAPARALVEEAHERGDCATVYDSAGHELLSTSCSDVAEDDSAGLVSSVLAHPDTRVLQDDQWLTTAVPIGDASDPVGVAVLSRAADPLHDRILAMWGWLTLIAVGALGTAVLMSVLLARWVGRPLRVLDDAAQQLGEGTLDARAPDAEGPQEVRRLAATFNTMAARTEALVHGHRAVVADVSHQLRTPLAALRLRLDLLAADAQGDTASELADAQGEIARLSRLVDGMLAVARAEHAVPRPVQVRVDRLVAERVAAWEPVADAGRVRLVAECRPGLLAFLGDGDLEQVLDNLVANALDAVPEGGQVLITGKRHGGTVQLRVVDNGPGMTRAARDSAFRRFGNHEASGTGLGLAIVHRLVTANGGTAELLDTPGGGLTVALTLPEPRRGRDRSGGRAQRGGPATGDS